MQLTSVDWAIIALYFRNQPRHRFFLCAARVRRCGGDRCFLSGRSVPWWLAGTSMVATTFGADTPLVVTGLIYKQGIEGNWLWWSFALSGMLTVFFFAPLWRRAEVLTDMEFAEIRYAGKPSAFLRGFRALYLGLPVNTIIMGWVNLAMAKVLALTLGMGKLEAVFRLPDDYADLFHHQRVVGGALDGRRAVCAEDEHGGAAGVLCGAWRGRHGRADRQGAGIGHGARHAFAQLFSAYRGSVLSELLCAAEFELVGFVVSGCGAGRRRLHCAADLQREGREELPGRGRFGSTLRTMRCGRGRGF